MSETATLRASWSRWRPRSRMTVRCGP